MGRQSGSPTDLSTFDSYSGKIKYLFFIRNIRQAKFCALGKQDKSSDLAFKIFMWFTDAYIIPPTRREGAILQSPCPSVHTFVTDISASTGRNDFIFDIWLWHGDLYRVSFFQVYRTSTSCLQCDLEFFMFAVMKTFVTVISASTGRNDFIFDIWLWHGDLYRVSPLHVYCTSTSCLPCDLQMNELGYS